MGEWRNMLKEIQEKLLIRLLPGEKLWDKDTKHDQLIIIGWNMYREELLKFLKLKK